jgi:hypothetical protein
MLCWVGFVIHAVCLLLTGPRSVGHWVLLKAGWLHRDVSAQNLMAIEPEARLSVKECVQSNLERIGVLIFDQSFDVSRDITLCTGIITDGDLAVRWRVDDRELATHRSVSV